MKRDVFISYSRRNYDAVVEIKRQIDTATGADCWMDLNAIESGADMFTQDIVAGINDCKVLLFMLSQWPQESEYALDELRFAKKKNKKIVLVNIDGCEMTDVFDFKYGGRDIILWNDTPQREKLLRDIARWIGVKSGSAVVPPSEPKIAPLIRNDEVFNVNGLQFKMVYVEGGTFMMGDDGYCLEAPRHKVTLDSYYIGETVVTQRLWDNVIGINPSVFVGDYVLMRVTWDDTQEFIKKLNKQTGRTFRLPTEAEWEFAARGGNKSKGYKCSGSNDIDIVAWYGRTRYPHPVKQKQANELGLYDMSGNVEEWCADWYGKYGSSPQRNPQGPSQGSKRVLRGIDRVSSRRDDRPDLFIYGFRLVLCS